MQIGVIGEERAAIWSPFSAVTQPDRDNLNGCHARLMRSRSGGRDVSVVATSTVEPDAAMPTPLGGGVLLSRAGSRCEDVLCSSSQLRAFVVVFRTSRP